MGTETLEDVARYYRETAWQYRLVWDTEHLHYGYSDHPHAPHRQALVRLLEVMADAAHVSPGLIVVDAGCGVGGAARWLATNRGARVLGYSIVPEQVEEAGRRSREIGDVRFYVADYRDLPLPDESADIVWALESSCYSRPKTDFLDEAFRVLRPHGRLIVADFYRGRQPGDASEEALVRAWEESWSMPQLQTQDELLDDLTRWGATYVWNRDITPNVLPSARRLYRLGRVFSPLARMAPGIVSRVPIRNIESAVLQWRAFEAGLASYAMTLATRPV
ncbi:MAG: methyltransferase domain-containing protein [Actinomycetota bacterium]|nr:methyltransferase domain-containing protein [Actinomycetota bacterium]